METRLKTLVFGAALAMAITAIPAVHALPLAAAQDRDHHEQDQHPDYFHNSYDKLGNREGDQDHTRKTERKEHNHKYRNDDDRQAHDYGYQQGLQGQRGYHPDQH